MLYELRHYTTPDVTSLGALTALFGEYVIPEYQARGTRVVGCWTVAIGELPRLTTMLAYDDANQRQAAVGRLSAQRRMEEHARAALSGPDGPDCGHQHRHPRPDGVLTRSVPVPQSRTGRRASSRSASIAPRMGGHSRASTSASTITPPAFSPNTASPLLVSGRSKSAQTSLRSIISSASTVWPTMTPHGVPSAATRSGSRCELNPRRTATCSCGFAARSLPRLRSAQCAER